MHKLDNNMSNIGGSVDHFLEMWYIRWHCRKRKDIFVFFLLCLIFAYWTFFPHRYDSRIAGGFYAQQESKVINWLDQLGQQKEDAVIAYSEAEELAVRGYGRELVFIVATSKDPLTVRDIPSVENCKVLTRVEKGSVVIWRGEMAFGVGGEGRTEPWARIENGDGVTGWVRMIYLLPKDEADYELNLLIE